DMKSLTLHYNYQNKNKDKICFKKAEVVIGRKPIPGVDLDLSFDLQVSRQHAILFYDLGTWWLQDLESKNGTFVNNKEISKPTELYPDDILIIGKTILRVQFLKTDSETPLGRIYKHFISNEAFFPPTISEDKYIQLWTQISSAIGQTKSAYVRLDRFMAIINNAFQQAERKSIILKNDRELIPAIYLPPGDQSFISFTLARRSIYTKQAFLWERQSEIKQQNQIASSLKGAMSALYAPIIFNNQGIGAVHLDTTLINNIFSTQDLDLLSVIANLFSPSLAIDMSTHLAQFPHIFVSYSRLNRNFTNKFAKDLRRRQIRVWFDERLKGGKSWRNQLSIAIKNTDVFILVLSPDSMNSENVAWELKKALILNKTILPILYQKCDIPKILKSIQYIDFLTNYQDGIYKLVERLYELKN
ncbi:MAG: TIR domain-containing protein, partial [Candidatus Lokiarchaeota archaeon]|nr:TIR domain-containing protein [Candidatus Lokiarchaeota archaeon]